MNVWFIAGAVVLLVAGLTLLVIHRKHSRMSDVITEKDCRPDLAERLGPYIGHPEHSRYMGQERLLDAIGGREGLRELRRANSAIGTLAARNKRAGEGEHQEWEQLFLDASWAVWVGRCASVELWLREKHVPRLPIVFTSAIARMFIDMQEQRETIGDIRAKTTESIHEYA